MDINKKQNIATIAFHRAINYGAVLQVYALQKKIEELGGNCTVLDYRNDLLESKHRETKHYSYFLRKSINYYIKKTLNETIEKSSAFICVSDSLRKSIKMHTNTLKELVVIPNLIDNIFTYNKLKNNDKYIFFSAGNLKYNKRFDMLINAFCNAFDKYDNAHLNIAGTGEEHDRLYNLIVSRGREHQIKLLGNLNRKEILKRYIECNCFVLPSRYETFGIVYREAMAVGRPIISTKNGGIEEGWEDNFGMLIPVDDITSLEDALINMYKHSDKYDLEYISKKCIEKYSSKHIGANITNVLIDSINSET